MWCVGIDVHGTNCLCEGVVPKGVSFKTVNHSIKKRKEREILDIGLLSNFLKLLVALK